MGRGSRRFRLASVGQISQPSAILIRIAARRARGAAGMTTIARVEDQRLLTGRGRFTDDPAAPGALWAVFARSPHAHAEIAAIDTAAAMALPGARLVLTGADLAAAGVKEIPVAKRLVDAAGRSPPDTGWRALALGRVRYVGEVVALCIADT